MAPEVMVMLHYIQQTRGQEAKNEEETAYKPMQHPPQKSGCLELHTPFGVEIQTGSVLPAVCKLRAGRIL
jgi:hypothetical protein